jgi:hypothetical protein
MYIHELHTLPTASPPIIPEHEHELSILPIQAIIARQIDGNTTIPASLTLKPSHTALPAWQIIVIVMGSLIFLSVLAILFLRIRTHYRVKRAASTTQFGGSLTGDGFISERKRSEGPDPMGNRNSLIGEARVQVRRLIKKSRPSGLTRSMEMTPNTDTKAGLSPLGFGAEMKRSSRKNGFTSRIKSDDMDSSSALGRYSLGRGPFHLQAERYSNPRSLRTGSNLTSIGREEDLDHGFGKSPASQHGIGPGGGRARSENEWDDDTHSVAHTIRDSFEDDHDQETETALGTSAPFTSPANVNAFPSSNGHSYTSYGLGYGSPQEQDLMDVRRVGHDKLVNRI